MQEIILLSNFWENIFENLEKFQSVGNEDSNKIASECLLRFNKNNEYVGEFDKLLIDVVNLFINDENIRSLFTYEEKELNSLLAFLKTDYDKIIEFTQTKIANKKNKVGQTWGESKEDDEIMQQKVVEKALNDAFVVSKLDANTLSDYGQKIGGAKKDTYRSYEVISSNDIMTQPLSKSFPEPDYVKLIGEGVLNVESGLLIKFFYSKIPTKPRNKYKLQRWANTVENAIELVLSVLSNKDSDYAINFVSKLTPSLKTEIEQYNQLMIGLGFPNKNPKLGNFNIRVFTGTGKRDEEGNFIRDNTKRYTIVNGYSIVKDFESMEDAIAGLNIILNIESEKPTAKKGTKFSCWRDSTVKNLFFIGKKTATGVIRLMTFDNSKECQTFLKENQDKLQEIWDLKTKPVKERPEINKERVGVDWRNNENITAEKLGQSFGFRGIEFGNYVNTKERQDHVNNAYDALMDLATTIGISTDLLAFGGQLGLAFGARGSGNASAHYESEKTVINLTKKSGAGSLAHEYWHALDNFFGKKRNSDYAGKFMTEKPRVLKTRDGKDDESVHPELVGAFKNIMDVIKATNITKRSLKLDSIRSKLYWSTAIELSARCFENYIIEKLGSVGTKNDYLANFSAIGEWISQGNIDAQESFPYPLEDESDLINEAYEQFFDTLKRVGIIH